MTLHPAFAAHSDRDALAALLAACAALSADLEARYTRQIVWRTLHRANYMSAAYVACKEV